MWSNGVHYRRYSRQHQPCTWPVTPKLSMSITCVCVWPYILFWLPNGDPSRPGLLPSMLPLYLAASRWSSTSSRSVRLIPTSQHRYWGGHVVHGTLACVRENVCNVRSMCNMCSMCVWVCRCMSMYAFLCVSVCVWVCMFAVCVSVYELLCVCMCIYMACVCVCECESVKREKMCVTSA